MGNSLKVLRDIPANTPSQQPQIHSGITPKAIVSHAKLTFPSAQLGEEKT